MRITICGSVAFQKEILSVKEKLEKLGHKVKIWPLKVKGEGRQLIPIQEYYRIRRTAKNDEKWVWDRKAEAILEHFNKIAWSNTTLPILKTWQRKQEKTCSACKISITFVTVDIHQQIQSLRRLQWVSLWRVHLIGCLG